MLGVGTYEFLVILVVAVLVLGPEHLPKVLKTLQKIMSTVRQVSTEFQRTLNLEETLTGTRYDKTTKKPARKKKKTSPPAAQDKTVPTQQAEQAAPTLAGKAQPSSEATENTAPSATKGEDV